MSAAGEQIKTGDDEIELFFFTTLGVRMGIDTRQIAAMLKPQDALQLGLSTISIHEGLQFRAAEIKYEEPHVLVMRNESAEYGILIDHPDEIALVKEESIRPLPEIISLCGGAKEIRGAVLEQDGITFLIDCTKIDPCKTTDLENLNK